MQDKQKKEIQEIKEPMQKGTQTANSESLFDVGAFYFLIGSVLLLPIFFIPFAGVPFQFTKTALISLGVFSALLLFLVGKLKEGSIPLPSNSLMIGVFALPIVYFISALFASPSVAASLFGVRFETDTVLFLMLCALALVAVPLIVRSKQRILSIYAGLLISFLILSLFQGLRLVFGADFLSFGIFTSSIGNLVGKWNDLGIFFGLIAVLSLITLEGLRLRLESKIVLYAALFLSLVFLIIINFTLAWVVLAVFSFGFSMYRLLKNTSPFIAQSPESTPQQDFLERMILSASSISVFIISLVFLISGNFFTGPLESLLGISQFEARPSWGSTLEIAKDTYRENFLLGSGPNTFALQWVKHKPDGVNASAFWNTDFNSGVGSLPTAFITSGLLGALAWLLFFGLFLYSGVRALLLRPVEESFGYYLSFSAFLASLYLWVFVVFYIPNAVIFFLAFFFTGLYLATLRHHKESPPEKVFVFKENPRVGFVAVLLLTLVLIFLGSGLYLVLDRYVAGIYFQRAVVALGNEGDEVSAHVLSRRARARVDIDNYARFSSELELRRLTELLQDPNQSAEEQRTRFEEILAGAIQSARDARDANPASYHNWLLLGRVYQSVVPLQIQGSYTNAKDAYEQALLRAPRQPSVYLALAELEVLNNDNESARLHITRALQEKSNYTAAVFLLAQIQVNEDKIGEAIQSVEAATLLEPQNAAIFFQLGLLKYNRGDFQGGAAAFERALRLNNDYANARYFLGLSYHGLGRVPEALEAFYRVLETNPGNEEVTQIVENLEEGLPPFAHLETDTNAFDGSSLPIGGE